VVLDVPDAPPVIVVVEPAFPPLPVLLFATDSSPAEQADRTKMKPSQAQAERMDP
jgi:hypothetical protein